MLYSSFLIPPTPRLRVSGLYNALTTHWAEEAATEGSGLSDMPRSGWYEMDCSPGLLLTPLNRTNQMSNVKAF